MVYELSKTYIQYVEDILNNKIPSCEAVYLQCKQFKERFNRDDIWFDYDDVDKRIKFVSKMKHWTGIHNKKPFILLPWQQFAFAGLFGWKWKKDNTRVTKNCLIMPVRKNGKTTLMAAIALIMSTIEGESGAEVDFVANSSKQASIGFNACRNLASSIDPNNILFKRYRDSIKIPYNNSIIQVLCSDSMTLDGYNSSCTLIDEMHAAKDWELYNVLKSSQGMRTQPLTIVCSTAGFLLDGYPLFDMRKNCIDILRGIKKDDTQFSLIYELDSTDDYHDRNTWLKCCPSLGQTVLESYIEDQIIAATNQPSLEVGVKTKNFNIFCQSSNIWLSSFVLDKVVDIVDLEDFKYEEAYVGIDLASVSDLTALSIMFPPNPNREKFPDKYVFKSICYIPSSALESINGTKYKTWKKHSNFKVCDGNVTDYEYILKDLVELAAQHNIQLIAYDEYNATQFTISATNEGMPMQPFSQSLGNFNKPTKQLERLILSEKCIIDKDDCVKWCFNNVVLKVDYHENCKPDKTTKENKIDPVISMIESLGAYLSNGGGDVEVV
jgi:phage terminase large subunit-like protein